MKYYLVGIKGSLLSAVALFLQDLGHFVEGSDSNDFYFTETELRKRSILIHSFSKDNIDGKSIYIISPAYIDHEETNEIIKNEYQYYYVHDFINTLYYKKIIAISGTHGKTTTTKMLSHFLKPLDVSYLIGSGEGYGSNNSKELILEACEYKEHFLLFNPYVSIINNIELDHPDYYKNIKEMINAFQKLANNSLYLIACGDDENIKKIKHPNKMTYGFDEKNDVKIKIINELISGYDVEISYENEKYQYHLPWCGRYMIYNFVATFSYLLRFRHTQIINNLQEKINNFSFPKRRNQECKIGETILLDDYAHHPTEINSLYQALKQHYPNYRIKVLFQPHTYTRTIALKKDFIKVLSLFDEVYVDFVFTSSREKYSEVLEDKCKKIFKKFKIFNNNTINIVKNSISNNEKIIWIFLGAGKINEYLEQVKEAYTENL